jgi:hypothetical protein
MKLLANLKDDFINSATEKTNYRRKINFKDKFLFVAFLSVYILSKPVYIYYKGFCEKELRIKKLKAEGKWVLE